MRRFKIYTAGKMGGLRLIDQIEWRLNFETALQKAYDGSCEIACVHPPLYYRYDEQFHRTEREVMQWDLSQIRDSDIVVIDLNTISDSIGTHMELGYIEAMNQFGDHHIYVIGIGKPNANHPWLNEVVFRTEETVEAAALYIAEYLLV